MGIAINKLSLEVFRSVETADYSEELFILIEKGRDNSDYEALMGAGVPQKYWSVVEGRLSEMAAKDKAVVDANELATAKRVRRTALERAANGFLQSKYTMEQQQTISYLMDEAERLGLTNRYDYFNQVGTWGKLIIAHFYYQEYFIMAATTIEQVVAVSLDFSSFLVQNPDVRIGVGSQIPD